MARALAAAGLACWALGCRDTASPVVATADLSLQFAVTNTAIVAVVVEVTAADISGTLIFNLPVSNGIASGSISIPVGSGRVITVRAYDAAGHETHRGSATIDVVNGTNPTTSITLLPLTGNVPIVVTVGSYIVTVTPGADTIVAGDTTRLAAVVLAGTTATTAKAHWASLHPWIATVDSGGLVSGLQPGSAVIVAGFGGAADSATVVVTGGSPSAPTVIAFTPAGTQHNVVFVQYTLRDATSDDASVAVDYSVDDGASWAPATWTNLPGDSMHGLRTSPAGIAHEFFWASRVDGVALSGTVSTVRIRITASDAATGTPVSTASFSVNNNYSQVIGVATGLFVRDLSERVQEAAIGDLTADAIRLRAGTQLAIVNGGSIRSPLPSPSAPTTPGLNRFGTPPFHLVLGDAFFVLPFSNRIVSRTVTGAQLWAALERSVSFLPSSFGGFLQISGFSFTYRISNPSGSRVIDVTLDGGTPIAADATTYTLALPDFLNQGGDGYSLFVGGTGTVGAVMATALFERIAALAVISPIVAGRIVELK